MRRPKRGLIPDVTRGQPCGGDLPTLGKVQQLLGDRVQARPEIRATRGSTQPFHARAVSPALKGHQDAGCVRWGCSHLSPVHFFTTVKGILPQHETMNPFPHTRHFTDELFPTTLSHA